MAIKINVRSTLIPVEIGELKYEVDITDQKYRAFSERFKYVQKELLKLVTAIEDQEKKGEEINEDELFEKLQQLVSTAYHELLGSQAFEQVYQQTPRLIEVTGYLVKLVAAIEQEMEADQGPAMSSYLKAKQAKIQKK